MALIGPRPERPAFCAEFEKRIHGWNYRALVKPGLSDLAQVRGGYDLLPKEKVALDLWRVGYPSLRIARVTDPPHSSTIFDGLAPLLVRAARHSRTPNRTDSVQLFVRTPHLPRMQRRDVQLWLSLRNLLDCSAVRSNYLVDTQ